KKRQTVAQRKVANLSGIPLHLRDGPKTKNDLKNNDFLIKDKENLPKTLANLQTKVVKEALVRLGKRKAIPTLRLYLTKDDLAELGLNKKKITGSVDSQTLAKKIRSLMNGFDLVRARGLNNPSPAALEKKYFQG